MGGSVRNSSSRIFETLQAETRKTKQNGRSVHKIFTNQQNLRQCISHMAMGEPWDAVEVKNGMVVGVRRVRAGKALIEMLMGVAKYRNMTPLVSSIAGVKGASPLSVSCVDWERSVRLTEGVAELRSVLRSSSRSRGWRLPERPWQDRILELRREARTSVFIFSGREWRVNLPAAAELNRAWSRAGAEGQRLSTLAHAEDHVLVSHDLDVMTDVPASDPRRQPLIRIRGRREGAHSIERFGHHVRVEWPSWPSRLVANAVTRLSTIDKRHSDS